MKCTSFICQFSILLCIILMWSCHDTPYTQGQGLYTRHCQNCHMEDGSGLVNLIPSLTTSSYMGSASMACVLVHGIRDTIHRDSVFLVREMPSFQNLSSTEVTNIINYVNHTWHPNFMETTILDVQNSLKECQLIQE